VVRATAAEMIKLIGLAAGTYPPGHDATTFGNFAAQVDSELDILALPSTLSTSDNNAVALANREAVNLYVNSIWIAAGGPLSATPQPDSIMKWSYRKSLQKQVRMIQRGTTRGPIAAVDSINTDV